VTEKFHTGYYVLIHVVACGWGLAMILYAVYHAYHSVLESSIDRLLIWMGVPLCGWSLYHLIIELRHRHRRKVQTLPVIRAYSSVK
jgi:hypothetical protein